MEWIICPAEGCGKKIKSLKSHYRSSHPDLDVPDMRDLKPVLKPEPMVQITEEEAKTEESSIEQTKQSDSMEEKLRMLGVDSAQVDAFFESRVVKVLEKMQLGEAINKKMADVEAKLGEKIQSLVERGQQLPAGQDGNGKLPPAPAQQGDALMRQVLPMLVQKFLNPKSGGDSVNLESMTKTLETARTLSDIFSKPYIEGQAAARREMNETIKLMSELGATPEQKRKVIEGKA